MVDLFGDYEALDENVNNMAKSELKQAAFVNQDRNPDTVAESVKLSKEVGMSPEFVESNFDTLKKQKELMATDEEYDQILRDNPSLSQYLADPINHATSKDDIPNLKQTEDLLKANADENGFYNTLVSGAAGFNKRLASIPYGLYSAAAAPQNIIGKLTDQPWMMAKPEDVLPPNHLYKYYDDIEKRYTDKVPELKASSLEAISKGNIAEAGKIAAYQALNQAPQLAVQISSAYALGPTGSLSLMGGLSYSAKSQENREAGVDEATNAINSTMTGGSEALFEKLGTFGVLKGWENAVSSQFGKAVGTEFVKNIFKTLGESYTKGFASEGATSLTQDLTDYVTGVNPDALTGSLERGFNSGFVGGFTDTAMTSPAAAYVSYHSLNAAKRAEINRDFFVAIGETIKGSKTRQRLPEGHKAYVDKLTANGPVENIYLDPDAVEEYFQSKDISPAELFQKIGLSKEYQQSKDTGTDLKIKTSDFVSKFLDTEHYAGLANDIKFDQKDQTVNQSVKFKKDLDEVFKMISDESNVADPKDSELAASIERQIIATGETPSVANKQAAVTAKFFEAMSDRIGITPVEFAARYGFTVERGIAPNETQTAINDAVDPVKILTQKKPFTFPETLVAPEGQETLEQDANGTYLFKPDLLEILKSRIADSDVGQRMVTDGGKSVSSGSTFPDFFKDKGYTKKETLNIIEKQMAGKKLTEKQSEILADLYSGMLDKINAREYFQAKKKPASVKSGKFKSWFGDSKVVDEKGKPLVVYHGGLGADQIKIFDHDFSGQTTGNNNFQAFHFTDEAEVAQDYSRQAFNRRYQDDPESLVSDGIVSELPEFADYKDQYAFVEDLANQRLGTVDTYLKIENPLVVNMSGERIDVPYIERLTNFAKNGVDENGEFEEFYQQKYGDTDENGDSIGDVKPVDGIIIKQMVDDISEASRIVADQFIVWNPENIKSIFNKGSFDPNDPNIFAQQDKKIYQGAYNPADRVIKLFSAKNKSTFLHEAAHFFLDTLIDIQKDQVLGPKVKADFDKILKFLEVEKAEDIDRPQHEKFARHFELYLREGKAPSIELKKSFNSFKDWLSTIYKKYTKNGVAIDDLSEQAGFTVEMNDEIRGVFDRMLATDAEIAQAKIESEIKPTLSVASMQILGYTEDEITAFITANEDWVLASEGKLYSKMEKAAELRQSKDFKDRVTELAALLTEDLRQDPIYNAIEVLSKAKTLDGVEVQKMKIDPESLERFDVTLDKKYTSKSTGVDVQIIADLFSIDVNDLMEGLQSKNDIATEALSEATRIAEAEFNEVGLDIKAEATEALHNASREDLIRLEMESILNSPVYRTVVKKTVRRVPPKADVKAKAAEIIGGRIVSDIKPYTYQRAEVRAAREAGIALAKGDLIKALEFKQKEYLNHELYLAAQDANKFVEKSLKKFKKMDKKTEDMAKTRDADLVNAAKAILGKFGIGKNQDEPMEYLKKIKAYDPEKYEVIENRIVDALTGATYYESATMDDFFEMATTVKELMDLAKLEKDYQIGTEKLKFDAVVTELKVQADAFGGEKGSENTYRETATKWDLKKAQFLSGAASLKRTEFWTDMMDLGKKNGAFTKYFWNPINQAQIQYDLKNEEISKSFQKIFEQYRPIFTEKAIAADEIGFKFKNKAELMMAVLHTGNESNKSKLLRGWGWGNLNDDGTLDSLNFDRMMQRFMQQGIITKADMDFAQEIWDLNEGLKPLAQKAHKQMFGYYFNEITSKELVTPFGVYKGGYIPAKVDVHESRDQKNRQLRSEFEESGLGMSFMYPTTGRGFTKSRIDAYAAPLSLDMNLLKHHVNSSLRFSILEPQVKAVAKLVYNKEFASMLSAVDKEAIDSIIVPFLQRAASQRLIQPSTNSFAKALSVPATYLRNTAALQLMTLNIANVVEQVFGLSIAAYKTKGMPTALFNYLKNARKTSEWVQEKSKYMHTINSKAVMDAQDVFEEIMVNPNFFQQKSHVIRKYSQFLQATTQGFVNTVAWSAAYSEAAARGDTDAEAIQHADKVVRTTQGGFRAIDAAAYEAGTPLWRLFTQFSGYFNMLGNLGTSEVTKIRKTLGLKKGAGKLTHLYIMGLMIPAIGSALLRGALAGKLTTDGDDEEDILLAIDVFLGSQFRVVTATVPIIGAFVNSGVNKFNKIPFDDSPSLSPVFSVGESLVGIPASIYKGMTADDVSNKKVLKDSLMMLGTISNLPLAPIGKPLGYLIDVDEGKAKPKNELDFARGLISGQAGK